MDEILEFLLRHCSFLYKDLGCRFVDSQCSKSFGGDALLILASDKVRFRFVRDRGQLFADFQGPTAGTDDEWFSIDIVRKHLTGESEYHSEMNPENIAFLKERFSEIEGLFQPSSLTATRKQLHKLEAERAKRLFG
ncbi:MAG: hypothetical protein CBB60_002165 [Armatimonadetes bacterium Cent15-Ar3]|nr:MAG: hypothetical protein CBB60_002165 [Armatimonadetes bacterium Cent15-Ar3]